MSEIDSKILSILIKGVFIIFTIKIFEILSIFFYDKYRQYKEYKKNFYILNINGKNYKYWIGYSGHYVTIKYKGKEYTATRSGIFSDEIQLLYKLKEYGLIEQEYINKVLGK